MLSSFIMGLILDIILNSRGRNRIKPLISQLATHRLHREELRCLVSYSTIRKAYVAIVIVMPKAFIKTNLFQSCIFYVPTKKVFQ